jgi:[ribosomal protein S5]-alanine N-acetyltransferase
MTLEPPVQLRLLTPDHAQHFVEAAARSADFHAPWVSPPGTLEEFKDYVAATSQERLKFGVWSADEQLTGVVNINAIIRGAFQNGSLGFYSFEGFQRRGYMSAGLRSCIRLAFSEHGLHRLEANIQPRNETSRRLVTRLGFRSEGIGRGLLLVDGSWRDHERFALTVQDWEALAR